ncbi:MAG TPA: DUF899 family protein [Pseudolabrys sp.]|jgi:predicted dithiol-disulfide oxidoreductase (DUF899 family)|nr:DUF899 family protein [Pseudolabrys sp.]
MAKARRKQSATSNGKKGAKSVPVRFPNERGDYRRKRNALLKAEMALRRQVEKVAALRRNLPAGGVVPEDYLFEENAAGLFDSAKKTRLSELFGDKDTLVIYSYMYGPAMEKPCPSCTSILDALDASAGHITQRVSLAVVAKSPIARIRDFARSRGWSRLRFLSSAGNTYNRDYRGETEDGKQLPALNVFVRRGRKIHHYYCTELLFAPTEKGQGPRHVDMIWPIWNMFDYTPDGRGGTWQPKLSYAG